MRIIIPGPPVPQARMKHSNSRGFVSTYDPKAKDKKNIRHLLGSKYSNLEFEFPRITFLFHMPIPKSIRKRDHDLYHSGTLKHINKPDVDNLIKLYLDCLDGIVINGDQKVSLGPCLKVYHEIPKTNIWIHETTQRVSVEDFDMGLLIDEEHDKLSFLVQDYLCDSCDPAPSSL